MISEIQLHNFKCFNDERVRVAPLTFLSGINGMGKSSIIQSLLLLRQSRNKSDLELNGELFEFGYLEDIYSENATDSLLSITVIDDRQEKYKWELDIEIDSSEGLVSTVKVWPDKTSFSSSLFGENFQFLSAERWGPRVHTPLNKGEASKNYLGKHGEYLVSVLKHFENAVLPNPDLPSHPDVTSRNVLDQVFAWLNEISPGSTVNIEAVKEADLGVYTFSYRSKIGKSRNFRPVNVGFGLSYTLSILIALLSAQKGSILLIENPEAHLHPKAQFKIGQLLSICANAGIQLIVESHSDHVLNGIRVSVKTGQIKNDDISIHFITRTDPNDIESIDIISPAVSAEGKLDQWPQGFFDEWDSALDQLL